MALAMAHRAAPFAASSAAPARHQPAQRLVCAATPAGQQAGEQQLLGRRAIFSGLALLAAAASAPQSLALGPVSSWDGESSAIGSCELGDAGDSCRLRILTRDRAGLQSYEAAQRKEAQVSGAVTGVPVADMTDVYSRETAALLAKAQAYAAIDLYDPARIQLVKQLKVEGPAWVSKYARGGSARKQSARKAYIVVDSLGGHFASNGMAPLPSAKLRKLLADIEATGALMAEGK